MGDKKSLEELHSYVRLILPMMSKYYIPLTPKNYTVWYEYVTGSNKELGKVIDAMLERGDKFSEKKNETLYQRYIADKDEQELKQLRDDLQKVLVTVLHEIMGMSEETDKYEKVISKSVNQLSVNVSIKKVRNIVNEIIAETKKIGYFGKSLKEKLKETTEELETLQKEFQQAKTEASMDFLTGIANRKAFDEALASFTDEAVSDGSNLCLLMIDIDHFKSFNDKYGHIVGDEVLKFVTKKTKEMVKGGDFVARFGGEEFAVILPRTSLRDARTLAEKIRLFFTQAKLKSTTSSMKLGAITVSIGIASYRPAESIESFIHRTDQALYHAKDIGRNCVATEVDALDVNESNHNQN